MEERQTGITTRQMIEAPEGAFYVWCNGNTYYPRRLALHLGRRDLRVVGSDWLMNPGNVFSALDVVIDHALEPTYRQMDAIDHIRIRQAFRVANKPTKA